MPFEVTLRHDDVINIDEYERFEDETTSTAAYTSPHDVGQNLCLLMRPITPITARASARRWTPTPTQKMDLLWLANQTVVILLLITGIIDSRLLLYPTAR